MTQFQQWLREHHVTEVECIVADINGVARGKILSGEKFLRSIEDDSLRLRQPWQAAYAPGRAQAATRAPPGARDTRNAVA